VKVVDPAGQTWRVKRRWLPWRLRRRKPEDFLDVPSGLDVDDLIIGLAIFVGLLLIAVLLPVVLVLAIVVAELLLLLLLLPVFVIMRAAFVARWPIEAWHGDRLVWSEAVRGWGSSRRRMLEVADGIRLGSPPVPARRHRAGGHRD
jgi:hypothetical protein